MNDAVGVTHAVLRSGGVSGLTNSVADTVQNLRRRRVKVSATLSALSEVTRTYLRS